MLWRLGSSLFSLSRCHQPASCSETVGWLGSFVLNVSDPTHAPARLPLVVPLVSLYGRVGALWAVNLTVTSADAPGSIDVGKEPTTCHGPLMPGEESVSGWSPVLLMRSVAWSCTMLFGGWIVCIVCGSIRGGGGWIWMRLKINRSGPGRP